MSNVDMFLRGYNPTPIEPRENALLRGLEIQRARQGNALQALQMQAFEQKAREEAAQRAQAQAAQKQRQGYLASVSGQVGPPQPFNPLEAYANGLPADAIKALTPAAPEYKVVGDTLLRTGPGGVDVAYKSDKAPKLPPLGELQAYRDSLPANDPRRREVQALIDNQTRAPKSAAAEVSPTALVDAGGSNQLDLAKRYGKASPGYRWKPDGTQEAVPGGPADRKNTDAGIREQRQREGAMRQAERVIGKVDEALAKVGLNTAGVGGAVLSSIPGTDARDLSATLETVKANLGFAELQAMRDASPTGGALGAIAVQELIALQSTVASLDQKQSPDQLRKSLGDIKRHYSAWKDAVKKAGDDGAAQPAAAPATSGGWKIERVQ